MYNEKSKNNLISLNDRTAEERRIIAKSGSKASIECKAEKRQFKDYFNSILDEKKEITKNGKKTKITKKEFIAYKLTNMLTSDKELEYKDIQAIKLLLEIIEEKPIDSLININNKQQAITIIDDIQPRRANIVELKMIKYLLFDKKPTFNFADLLQSDFLFDAILSIQLNLAELRRKGKDAEVEKIIEQITDFTSADALFDKGYSFISELNEKRTNGASIDELAKVFDNNNLKSLVEVYKKLQEWESNEY